MQKNKQIDTMQLGVLLLLVLALVSIRIFENSLFYDPLIAYYKGNFNAMPLPKMHQIKLFTSLGFRFYLNSILSLGIIHLLFKNPTSTKFALLLYLVLGSVLLISFVFMLEFFGETNKMTLFYIRRFIIQPLFLILFVPAFYYQNKMQNNK
jgi:exosortase F-associated protein